MRPDMVPGATFPDYELPDHTEKARRLSELQGEDPLILTLARGHYRWYVYPGLGKRTANKYGPLIGSSDFFVKKR